MNQDYFSVMLNDILVYTTCLDDPEFIIIFFHNFTHKIYHIL